MGIDELRLGIFIPERNVFSESFIESHIDGLFDEPLVVWGSPRPLFHGDGDGLLSGLGATVAKMLVFVLGMTAGRAQGAVGRRLPDTVYSRELARFLQRADVEVVLAEYGPTAVAIMDACAIARIPLVVHFHGYDAYQRDTLDRFRASYARLFEVAYRIVAVSKHMVGQLGRLGAPVDRIVYNRYGVDTVEFRGGQPGSACPTLLALGRFVDKKAPNLTLKAFAQVLRQEPHSNLVMLGDGPLRDACVELARDLEIASAVSFPGIIDHDGVVGWMRRVRCFVQHSRRAADGDSEGTPLALLEASSCGLPVVSTRHGGIVEAVRDGISGFLVEEGDVSGMASHMLRLVREPELAENMGAAGRRHIEANYSSQQSLDRLRSILTEAARRGA